MTAHNQDQGPREPASGPTISRPQIGATEANPLRHCASILRRRWIWIALGVAVGLAAGFASTLFIKEERDPTHYYKATNTLIAKGFDPSSGSALNLQQAAYLVRSAEVRDEVAAKLGVDPQVVSNQVNAVARSDVQAIDVTGIGSDPAFTVELADVTAQVLNSYLASDAKQTATSADQDLTYKLDLLRIRRAELEQEVTDGSDSNSARSELESVNAEISEVTDQLAALASQTAAAGALSTLQTASPVEINGGAYSKRYNTNLNARGGPDPALASVDPNSEATDSETDLSSSPLVSKPLRILIGGLAGLVLGLATAFIVEAWDDRVRRRDRVEQLTGFPVIAEVPKLPREQRESTDVTVTDSPRSNAAERYRSVKTAVLFALREHYGSDPGDRSGEWSGRSTPVVLIGSPNPSEGKTTTVANVAAEFGASGMRTLVIDCDYHRPSISSLLAPVPDLDNPDNPAITRLDGVWFLPAPREMHSSESITHIRENIAAWRDQFDIVLLDTPPILSTNDAADLIPVADTVVLVLRANQSRSGPVERVATLLARYRADVLGVVFNGVEAAEMEAYYGYYYGYGDETRTRGSDRTARSATDEVPEPLPDKR